MALLMRRKHSIYILLAGVSSIVSLILVCTSFGTRDWIRGFAHPNIEGPEFSNVNYGLFTGTLVRRVVESPKIYDLYFTCLWNDNSCAWSCANSEVARENEIKQLVNGETAIFSCVPTGRNVANFINLESKLFKGDQMARIFTNAGLWVTTIIFIVILIIALIASIVLSILNCIKSPIETFLNVQGIYVANGVAFVANFFALMLYGICYSVYINKNIAIFDTIVGDYWSVANLGYSYWILLPSCLFHGVGIFLIAMRERIVNSDRAETKIDVSTEVPETGVMF